METFPQKALNYFINLILYQICVSQNLSLDQGCFLDLLSSTILKRMGQGIKLT